MAAANPEGVIGFYQTTPVPSSPLPVLEILSSDLAFRQRHVHESDCVRPPSDRVQTQVRRAIWPTIRRHSQALPPAIETAQAAQLQNLQPGYVPQPPTQGAPHQTLTLPRGAPQSPPLPALELPRSQGQEGSSLEVPIERQPQTTAGRISITATDDTGRWIQDLRKQDLNLYEDGIQRPVLSLQRDVETPATSESW